MSRRAVVRQALADFWTQENITKLRSLALRLTHNDAEADELLQEACARVLEKPLSYDSARPFGAWVSGVLVNAFRDSRRAHSWSHSVPLDLHNEDGEAHLINTLTDGQPGQLAELLSFERSSQIGEALAKLQGPYRDVLTLCDVDGSSYEDAAQKLGVPLGTIRSRLARARSALRRLLKSAHLEGL